MRLSTALALPFLFIALVVTAVPLPRFPGGAVWNREVSTAAVHPDSATMISTVAGLGGFGNGRMQIDFSLHVVQASPDAPTRKIIGYPSFDDYYSPDCQPVGSQMPVPLDAAIEGETGLSCDQLNADCHLLVVQGDVLYEAFQANASGDDLEVQCLAVWQLNVVYPPEGRGEHCTSADAAGFPMAPLLFNADEIAASLGQAADGSGDIGHAIRFILPNARMASDDSLGGVEGRLYVRPASHAGGPSGPEDAIPYGSRLRLRADFPLDGYNPAARVILNTLKRYGMVLADGGSIALTAESDLYTDTSWDDLQIGSRIFDTTSGAQDVAITDFEVLDTGPRIAETYECVRTEIPTDVLFSDGFE